jgi:RNA polymerase sigma-70 factor (ECF subfamily)
MTQNDPRPGPGGQAPDPKQRRDTERLLFLLAPIQARAQQSARRLSRCNADGDDLFQEAVLRALRRIGDLRDESKFSAWFYAVMISVHRARCRADFWRRFLPLSSSDPEPGPRDPPRPGAHEEQRAGAARMASALAALPPEQREAVVLFEVDGFSIEEVAAMQESSVTAVKTRLMRGRERLRRRYEELLASEAREGELRQEEVSHV